MPSLITNELMEFARSEFRLDWHGIHDAGHWARVRHNGLMLAAHTGANPRVVEYFAFLHDLGRENELMSTLSMMLVEYLHNNPGCVLDCD